MIAAIGSRFSSIVSSYCIRSLYRTYPAEKDKHPTNDYRAVIDRLLEKLVNFTCIHDKERAFAGAFDTP